MRRFMSGLPQISHRVREPSLRHYVRAKELKAAGMDWTAVLAAEDENKRARLAAEILESNDYDSTAARVAGVRRARGRVPGDLFQPPAAAPRWGDGHVSTPYKHVS